MIPTDLHDEIVTTATRLERLPLPTRAINSLEGDGVYTVGEVLSMTEAELLRVPNIGRKTLHQLRDVLETYAPIGDPPPEPAKPAKPQKAVLQTIPLDEELIKILLREIVREHDIAVLLREIVRKELSKNLHKVLTLLD